MQGRSARPLSCGRAPRSGWLRGVTATNRQKVALATAVVESQNAAALLRRLSCRRARRRFSFGRIRPTKVPPPRRYPAAAAPVRGSRPLLRPLSCGRGAATEFAGYFNRMIIPAMGIDRVIVRRTGVRVRLVLVAMGVRVVVTRVREGRSAVLRQDLLFLQCRRCGLRVVVPPGRFRHPRPRLRHARVCFWGFRESQTSFSARSVPFQPSFEGFSVLWGCLRPPLIRFRPSFRVGFRLSRSVSTPSAPLPPLLLMVSSLSVPLTGFRPSFPRGIPCLTLPLFQPFISVVLSKTQTPLFTFPVLSLYSLA